MQELTELEIAEVSGAACDTCNGGTSGIGLNLDAAATGFFKGALIGTAMVKYATGGGILFGAIAQGVGLLTAPLIGGVLGAGLGLVSDRATVDKFANTIAESFGPGK